MNTTAIAALGLVTAAGLGLFFFARRRRKRLTRFQKLARDAEDMLKQAETRLEHAREAAAKVPERMRGRVEQQLEAIEARRDALRHTVEEVRSRARELVGQRDGR